MQLLLNVELQRLLQEQNWLFLGKVKLQGHFDSQISKGSVS
jgi:hypothetical protein